MGWECRPPAQDGVRYFDSPDGSDVSYPDEGLSVLGADGGAGFWFDHRAAAVRRHLETIRPSSMWEVGAGNGAMAKRLSGSVVEIVTVEPIAAGAQAAAALGFASLCARLEDLHLPDDSIPSVGVFDVLEHVEDPTPLVREMYRVRMPGGTVFATVPAHDIMWGDEDDVAGHYRRYTRSMLEAQFTGHGFVLFGSEHLFACLLPAAALLRALPYRLGRRSTREAVLQRMRGQLAPAPRADRLARAALAAESAVSKKVPLPFGLSLLGVFCKR